ncbi:hypothetical protein PUN28_001020 [Cardiocondyla obscurior]|uniref:Uncharacterized protein n=1 Tax=Cardiocondyla obscurior TaxID=286306 RepID=A0AAW2H2H3_9HYME
MRERSGIRAVISIVMAWARVSKRGGHISLSLEERTRVAVYHAKVEPHHLQVLGVVPLVERDRAAFVVVHPRRRVADYVHLPVEQKRSSDIDTWGISVSELCGESSRNAVRGNKRERSKKKEGPKEEKKRK